MRWADDEAGAALHQRLERPLDVDLGADIDAAGGVVEDQDARVHQQRPGDSDALSLAATEGRAALAHGGVVALGKVADEPVGGCCFGGGDHLGVVGVGLAEGDVVADGAAHQGGLLKHDADASSQALEGQLAHVTAVDQHRPLADVVEARDEVDDGGLAAAGGAEQRHRLSGLGP